MVTYRCINPQDENSYYNLGILNEIYLGNLKDARSYYDQYQTLQSTRDLTVDKWIKSIDLKMQENK